MSKRVTVSLLATQVKTSLFIIATSAAKADAASPRPTREIHRHYRRQRPASRRSGSHLVHQIIFVGAEDSVANMEPDENPANQFPCMSSQQFHRDARGQLYALATGEFLDVAMGFEMLDQTPGLRVLYLPP